MGRAGLFGTSMFFMKYKIEIIIILHSKVLTILVEVL